MNKPIYIHYGSTKFDPNKGFPIKNSSDLCIKPQGGLWASRTTAECGWKQWCEAECFRDCIEENSFKFIIKDGFRVETLSNLDQLTKLPPNEIAYNKIYKRPPPIYNNPHEPIPDQYFIDFEKCLNEGISAIELCFYGLEYTTQGNLHYALYGWDCDSIVILDPNCVEEI